MNWGIHVTKVPFVSEDMLARDVQGIKKQSKSLTPATVRWDDSTTLE
jgi:hypothetical protein